jgi:hypothetical protein
MKHYTQIIRYTIVGCLLCGALVASGALHRASAQDKSGVVAQPVAQPKGERDPFVPYKPPVRARANKALPVIVTPPAIQERIDGYKSQKMAAMNAQRPAPKATTALLLSEMQVIGIFRTPRGFAAMVEATPIKLSYVVYPGEVFYDGQLVAIEENRLVFRQETRWSDGRRDKKVETKPLRKANAVVESLAATREASGTGAPAAADSTPNAEEKASAPEKQ